MSTIALGPSSLEYCLERGPYGLSARRLWEHTEMGQINVFSKDISQRQDLNDAETFIDIVKFDGDAFWLAGLTLADLRARRMPRNSRIRAKVLLDQLDQSSGCPAFVSIVRSHLGRCAIRQALRNQHHQFLPTAKLGDVFGIPLLYSSLQRRLLGMGKSRAGAEQWLKTIENFQKKGLRAEELECSDLIPDLSLTTDDDEQFSALELVDECDFTALRLSVIPVVNQAQRQLRFTSPPNKKLNKTRNLPKAVAALPRAVTSFDPVLGYRLEKVEHQSLWGKEHSWQAVTHEGKVIHNAIRQSGFQSAQTAADLAASHASALFPKRVALGHYSNLAWTGGESYREWLITLPYYPASYLSGHFNIRNILAHVRCDGREGADGERVLMLQEVQSDWAQRARRALSKGEMVSDDEVPPPFMKEWPALVMKLVLLHAAHQGLDAVAWTRGAHQVFRYKGLGAGGLNELYDRTLPRDVNRMMKPFGASCETRGVYVPTNFRIKQSEDGYDFYAPDDEVLGTAPTLEDAREFVPDQGHELLFDVHGVRLSAAVRKAILENGFPAWG
jgi:hypothetical protein